MSNIKTSIALKNQLIPCKMFWKTTQFYYIKGGCLLVKNIEIPMDVVISHAAHILCENIYFIGNFCRAYGG